MDPDGGNDRVTAELTVNAGDLKAFSQYVERSPRLARSRRNYRLSMWAVWYGGWAVLAFTDAFRTVIAVAAPMAVLTFLARRSWINARLELVQHVFDGDFTADAFGFSVRRTGSFSQRDWSALHELVVTDDHLFARSDALGGYVIPRRCLRNPEDVDRMIRWRLAAKAGANRRPPPPPPPYRPPTDSPAYS